MGAGTTTVKSPESVRKSLYHEGFGSSYESEKLSRDKILRPDSYDASAKHEDVSHRDDVDDSSRSHRAASIPVIVAIVLSLFFSALMKRRILATCYDLLLKTNHGCILNAS